MPTGPAEAVDTTASGAFIGDLLSQLQRRGIDGGDPAWSRLSHCRSALKRCPCRAPATRAPGADPRCAARQHASDSDTC